MAVLKDSSGEDSGSAEGNFPNAAGTGEPAAQVDDTPRWRVAGSTLGPVRNGSHLTCRPMWRNPTMLVKNLTGVLAGL